MKTNWAIRTLEYTHESKKKKKEARKKEKTPWAAAWMGQESI